jgi:integrase
MVLKGVVQRAHKRGLIKNSPFAEFHIAKNIRERQFLTEEEIMRLLSHTFEEPMQAYTRDIFVFSVFTGMSFIDICGLRKSDIQKIDGHEWIVSKRHKTGIPFRVRLLEQPLSIIRRYVTADKELIFDRCKYHTIAKRLPTVLEECGINKHITFHCGRHTFAIMALNQGMPIESVSHILGHSNITTTQIYARITMKKLNMDFLRLEHGLAPIIRTTAQKGVVNKVKSSILYFLHLFKQKRPKC